MAWFLEGTIMIVTAARQHLIEQLTLVGKALTGKALHPLVAHYVRLDLRDDGATLYGTDLETSLTVPLTASYREYGTLLLPYRELRQVCEHSSAADVTVEMRHTSLIMHASGTYRFYMPDVADYPLPQQVDSRARYAISVKHLRTAMARTEYVTDSGAGRYAMHGVKMEIAAPYCNLIATDGRRLSLVTIPCEACDDAPEECDCLVPRRAAKLLSSLPVTDGDVLLAVGPNAAQFECEAYTLTTLQLEGKFPQWQAVVEKTSEHVGLDLSPLSLSEALKRVAVVCTSESPHVTFSVNGGTLKLSASTERGEAETEIPIQGTKQAQFILDYRYVQQYLESLSSGEAITLKYKDSDKPTMWSQDQEYKYLLMPMVKQ
jgi:DNA polymerase-3 subunit beta